MSAFSYHTFGFHFHITIMRLTVSVFLLLARKEEARDLFVSLVIFELGFFLHFLLSVV